MAKKNTDAYLESFILNSACLYSMSCRAENHTPRLHVMIILLRACFLLPLIRAWWDHVTDTPDEIKISVFNRGTLIGLNLLILLGGHVWPISMLGDALSWK